MTSSAAPVHWWPFALNSIKISEKIINIFRQWRIVLRSICIIISLRNVNVYPSIGFVGPWLLNHFMIAQSNFLFSLNSSEILNQDTQVYTLKKSTFSFIDIKLNSSIIILQIWSWDGVVKITNEPTAFHKFSSKWHFKPKKYYTALLSAKWAVFNKWCRYEKRRRKHFNNWVHWKFSRFVK